ncbi:hypothetical protein DM02DRAFT_343866 [Periconia macrospinosa]|uniref:Uncharacterized protein n=1 Tax=Periconia macrospinosa TaxID=97972 RepID=A0A2V1D037_9PLEO|nr:hypothetical protein DM02DRAFT_343866 [Periconia macrospinosa]
MKPTTSVTFAHRIASSLSCSPCDTYIAEQSGLSHSTLHARKRGRQSMKVMVAMLGKTLHYSELHTPLSSSTISTNYRLRRKIRAGTGRPSSSVWWQHKVLAQAATNGDV